MHYSPILARRSTPGPHTLMAEYHKSTGVLSVAIYLPMLWIMLPHLRTQYPWLPQPLPPYLLLQSCHRQRMLLQVSPINVFFRIGANSSHIIVENLPEPPSGHLMSILMFFNSQVAGPVGRGSKLVTKKVKSDQIWTYRPRRHFSYQFHHCFPFRAWSL